MDWKLGDERRGERRSGTGDSMTGEFGAGGIITMSVEVWSHSISSSAGDNTRVLDNVVQEVDSSPLKKGPVFLNGVGANRSGNSSAVGYNWISQGDG